MINECFIVQSCMISFVISLCSIGSKYHAPRRIKINAYKIQILFIDKFEKNVYIIFYKSQKSYFVYIFIFYK